MNEAAGALLACPAVPEAELRDTPEGRAVASAGWFVLNLTEAAGESHELAGFTAAFERPDERFPDLGINVRVLEPAQPAALYHQEDVQEDFLVLEGECLLLIDDQERRLRKWDLVHCPPGTPHVIVGAGERSCAILMVGRRGGKSIHYPVSQAAARYGASVPEPTDDPRQAYASAGWRPEFTPARIPWPRAGG